MIILSIDTTAKTSAAAICDNKKTLADYSVTNGFTHSEAMLPAIDGLFKKTGLSPDDIDMFAVSAGPGSFTGVRIGVSLIKGLAFGKNRPCVGVSSLEALARNGEYLGGEFIASPVMDARRNQLYNALFHFKDGTLTRLCPDRLVAAEELLAELEKLTLPVYFFGDGYEIARKAFPRAEETENGMIFQNASSVARAALHLYNDTADKSIFTDMALSPTYLRASQAEREFGQKEKNQ